MADFETALCSAQADLSKVRTETADAVTDIKMLVANRIGDVLIAAIVLGSIWIGHIL